MQINALEPSAVNENICDENDYVFLEMSKLNNNQITGNSQNQKYSVLFP